MSGSENAAGSGGKKKKAARGPEVLWTVRLSMAIQRGRESTRDVLRSLSSPDQATRRMATLFVACLVCIGLVATVATHRLVSYKLAQRAKAAAVKREENALSDFLKKQSDLAQKKSVMFPLGQFTLELRSPAGERKSNAMNLADVEIVLECDSKDTRVYFEDHLPQTRNQVTDALVAMDRAELLSQDGKLRLKRMLLEKLNLLLPKGHVENLYFSKLLLS